MIKLFFDIETIPCAEEEKEVHVEILKKRLSNNDKTDDDIHKETSLEEIGRASCRERV